MPQPSYLSKKIISSLALFCAVPLLNAAVDEKVPLYASTVQQAVLQGQILVEPLPSLLPHPANQIQPGSAVKVKLVVENKGNKASPAGEAYARYAFPAPLDKEPNSELFTTEKVALPSIPAGEKVEVVFTTPHYWPAVTDFVREDWAMREYQAFASVNGKELPIGTLAIAYSTHYYPGLCQSISATP